MKTPSPQAIVIGGSAGAIEALSAILPNLPRDYPLPIIVVVHLPTDRSSVIADLFAMKCSLKVVEAEDKTPIEAGCVYFAPPDYHLLVEPDRRLSLSADEPIHYSRPSIDVLFESAADAYREALVGIILTGANNDGANGLKSIASVGGTALVQSPDRAYATMMPRAALDACPAAQAMPLKEITQYLLALGAGR